MLLCQEAKKHKSFHPKVHSAFCPHCQSVTPQPPSTVIAVLASATSHPVRLSIAVYPPLILSTVREAKCCSLSFRWLTGIMWTDTSGAQTPDNTRLDEECVAAVERVMSLSSFGIFMSAAFIWQCGKWSLFAFSTHLLHSRVCHKTNRCWKGIWKKWIYYMPATIIWV